MNIKKYSWWILVALILLASGKAVMFTRDLVLANYFFPVNKEKAAAYMYRILCQKPITFLSFRDIQKKTAADFIVKKAIYAKYRDNKNIFAIFNRAAPAPAHLAPGLRELSVEHFKDLYRDNFYFQYTFPPIPSQPNWKNLDAISLELLADKTLNPLTRRLWEEVKSTVDPGFTANLGDYCRWQGNMELAGFLGKGADAGIKPFFYPAPPTGSESFKRLLQTIKKNNKLSAEDIKEIRAGSENFNDPGAFVKKWEFSTMTDNTITKGGAAFAMGLEGAGENRCLRVMGFYTGRGGARRKENLPLSNGYYLLSFDYLTATGREKPSFYLRKGLSEVFLPAADGGWKKAVYFLNNSTGVFNDIKPIFRMWGTGTVLIDNVTFAAITKPSFSFKRTAMIYTPGRI